MPDRAIDIVVQAQRGVIRQVVEQRCGLFKEQRQVIFDPVRGDAFAYVLVDARPGRVAFEALAETLAEIRLAFFVQRKFARRQQANLRHRIQRALRVHIKGGDGLDLVIEQVDAIGQRAAHRKQVDQPAAHAVFARGEHLLHMSVARQSHLFAQPVQVEPVAALQEKGIGGEVTHRRQRIQRGGDGHYDHIAGVRADVVQGGQTLGNQVLVRREMVVRQRLPVRQQMHAQARVKERNFLQQPLRFQRVGGDYHLR